MLRREKLLSINFDIRLKINFSLFKFSSISREIRNLFVFRARFFVLFKTINLSIIIVIVVIITIRIIVSFLSRVSTISLSIVTNVFLLLFLSTTILISIKVEDIEIEKYVITSSLRIIFFFKKSIFFFKEFLIFVKF